MPPRPVQCTKATKSGERCKMACVPGRSMCKRHLDLSHVSASKVVQKQPVKKTVQKPHSIRPIPTPGPKKPPKQPTRKPTKNNLHSARPVYTPGTTKSVPVGRLAEAVHAVKAVRVEGPKLDFIRSDMTAAEKKKVVERNRNAQEQHKQRIVTAMKSYDKDRAQIRQNYNRRRLMQTSNKHVGGGNMGTYEVGGALMGAGGAGYAIRSGLMGDSFLGTRDEWARDFMIENAEAGNWPFNPSQPIDYERPVLPEIQGYGALENPTGTEVRPLIEPSAPTTQFTGEPYSETLLPEPYPITTTPNFANFAQAADEGLVESNVADGWTSSIPRPMPTPSTGLGGSSAAEAAASGAVEAEAVAGAGAGAAEAAAGAGVLETIGEVALALLPFGL